VTRLERYARLAGVPAGAPWLVGIFVLELGGNTANPDSAAEIADHFRDHRDPRRGDAFAVFLTAVSALALQRVLLPRWLGWTGLVVALILLVPPIGWAALIVLVPLWLALVSATLFLRGPTADAGARSAHA
jgi:hypothetical protein